ncbi:MAG: tripartite tricarboxylate transporter substrate binding protein [Burkholderiales bacterium]|nr:tripartite tricarboxylate transporter substrate binding protein [Burkholderiales bacterium]MCW5604517.1 tripartite tricarboxylate transporter substrate binding protein [Burkholderiales bacterium]
MKHGFKILAALPALFVISTTGAHAQSYPGKTVTISIATAAGSAPDTIIRAMAQKMNEAWRQPVIVENRATAGGIAAVTAVTKSAPDGHTLLVHTAAFTIAPSMYKLPYDTFRDLLPVSIIAYVPNMLVAHPTLPVRNVKELIALAKARAGDLNYASSGSGTPAHLAGELFKSMAGVNILHVPYKGSPPALTSVLAGETSMLFSPLTIAIPHTQSGKLRALGVTTAKRSKLVPDLPTIAESGLPGYEVTQWYGMQVPAGTPKDVIARINGEVGKILAMPDIIEKLATLGAEPAPSTPEFMTAYVKSEVEKWNKVVKASGAKVD